MKNSETILYKSFFPEEREVYDSELREYLLSFRNIEALLQDIRVFVNMNYKKFTNYNNKEDVLNNVIKIIDVFMDESLNQGIFDFVYKMENKGIMRFGSWNSNSPHYEAYLKYLDWKKTSVEENKSLKDIFLNTEHKEKEKKPLF